MSSTMNKASGSGRLCYLDSMRAVAMMMVVGIHSVDYCLPLPPGQALVIAYLVHKIAVPVFFMVDGFLFAARSPRLGAQWYPGFVRSSFVRLVIPWLIFTLLYLLARLVFESAGVLNDRLVLGLGWDVARNAYGSVIAPQLYFLLSLFLIRTAAPLWKWLVDRDSVYPLMAATLLCFAAHALLVPSITPLLRIEGGQEPVLHALWGLKFYFTGLLMQRVTQRGDIDKWLIPLVVLTAGGIFVQEHYMVDLSKWTQLGYLLAFFTLFHRFGFCVRGLDYIGRNTMGIYLVHTPVVLKAVSILLAGMTTVPLVSYLLLWSVVMAVSLVIVEVINKIRYGPLLFGVMPVRRTGKHQ